MEVPHAKVTIYNSLVIKQLYCNTVTMRLQRTTMEL